PRPYARHSAPRLRSARPGTSDREVRESRPARSLGNGVAKASQRALDDDVKKRASWPAGVRERAQTGCGRTVAHRDWPSDARVRCADVRIGLLGPELVVADDGTELPVRSAKQRAVLAVLALRVGSVVRMSEIVTALWGDDPPRSAVTAVKTY